MRNDNRRTSLNIQVICDNKDTHLEPFLRTVKHLRPISEDLLFRLSFHFHTSPETLAALILMMGGQIDG